MLAARLHHRGMACFIRKLGAYRYWLYAMKRWCPKVRHEQAYIRTKKCRVHATRDFSVHLCELLDLGIHLYRDSNTGWSSSFVGPWNMFLSMQDLIKLRCCQVCKSGPDTWIHGHKIVSCWLWYNNLLKRLEAATGFEPVNNGFADRRLTTWLCRPGLICTLYKGPTGKVKMKIRIQTCCLHAWVIPGFVWRHNPWN